VERTVDGPLGHDLYVLGFEKWGCVR
jgi:hypothetical protein